MHHSQQHQFDDRIVCNKNVQPNVQHLSSLWLRHQFKYWLHHAVLSRSFEACWESLCRRKSTFLWNRFSQIPQANGLYPLCFLIWVIRLEDWLNTFPHTTHLCGFSPAMLYNDIKISLWRIKSHLLYFTELKPINTILPVCMYVCFFMSDFWWNRFPQYWHG